MVSNRSDYKQVAGAIVLFCFLETLTVKTEVLCEVSNDCRYLLVENVIEINLPFTTL